MTKCLCGHSSHDHKDDRDEWTCCQAPKCKREDAHGRDVVPGLLAPEDLCECDGQRHRFDRQDGGHCGLVCGHCFGPFRATERARSIAAPTMRAPMMVAQERGE